jgi:triosephosphate isomerase
MVQNSRRRPIVAGNWKMNKLVGQSIDLAAEVKRRLSGFDAADIVLCPPFTALKSVGDLIRFSDVKLGAQNLHWEAEGAYTGEVSAAMLQDLACEYVIIGHSERRAYFGETDEGVNRKARAALDAGLKPIICFGETLEQREAGRTEEVVREQVQHGLDGLAERLSDAVIAYEPVWAIGTGRTATTAQAQEAHAFIRGMIGEMAGPPVAASIRIQYGGSVKPSNAGELFGQPDVDGGLIGGASLQADSFVGIVEATTSG